MNRKLCLGLASLSCTALLVGCAPRSVVIPSNEFSRTLTDHLSGDFATEENRVFNTIRMGEFRNAVYVEEASEDLDGVDRQWVFQIVDNGETGSWVVQTWRITRPELYEAAWVKPDLLNTLTMYDLRHEPSCDIPVSWNGVYFFGSNSRTDSICEAVNGGIQEVEIHPDRVVLRRSTEEDWITLSRAEDGI